jgi:hypothetical protein
LPWWLWGSVGKELTFKGLILSFSICFVSTCLHFVCSAGDGIQGLKRDRQVLYHSLGSAWLHPSSSTCHLNTLPVYKSGPLLDLWNLPLPTHQHQANSASPLQRGPSCPGPPA